MVKFGNLVIIYTTLFANNLLVTVLSTGRKPNYKFLMTTQAPHPKCLYLDMMLRLSIPLSTLVPALIQLVAVSTTPVGGSNYHVRA